jgi:hypothetical protein
MALVSAQSSADGRPNSSYFWVSTHCHTNPSRAVLLKRVEDVDQSHRVALCHIADVLRVRVQQLVDAADEA